jgi:hypothetical protein
VMPPSHTFFKQQKNSIRPNSAIMSPITSTEDTKEIYDWKLNWVWQYEYCFLDVHSFATKLMKLLLSFSKTQFAPRMQTVKERLTIYKKTCGRPRHKKSAYLKVSFSSQP